MDAVETQPPSMKKNVKNLLTNSTKYAIIKAHKGMKEAGALRGRWVQLPPSPPKNKKK